VKHPPPWWLRLPIYVDWIQLSTVVVVLVTLLAHGELEDRLGQSVAIIAAAAILITLDALGGLGHAWALIPRAGLAFLALVWIERTIGWRHLNLVEQVLIAIGIQQLWVLAACVAGDLRLRFRSSWE
jgi:hypothetical protein